MKDVEKLIGGYATGTLTGEERDVLFAEALQNQALFDALADEEALRDALSDPAARRRLLATLERKESTLFERLTSWFFRPLPMALTAGVSAAVLAVFLIPRLAEHGEPTQVAMSQPAQQVPEDTAAPQAIPEALREEPLAAAPQPDVETRRAPAAASAPVPAPSAGGESGEVLTELRRETDPAPVGRAMEAPALTAPREPQPAPAPAPSIAADRATAAPAMAKSAASTAPAFTHSIELQDAEGRWTSADSNTGFDRERALRLAIQPLVDGYVHIEMSRPGAAPMQLYLGAVRQGVRLAVPSDGGLPVATGVNALTISYAQGPPLGSALTGPQGLRARKESSDAPALRDAPTYSVTIPLQVR